MTRAPANLLAVRTLLLQNLGSGPGVANALQSNEVGIVGDSAHRGGYHCGSDRVVPNDYSVVESSRDRNGLTLDAAALDVGQFSYRDPLGRTHNLHTFSKWCVVECRAGAPDTLDIREIIYSPDGKVVLRYDRLGRRSSGDRSHLWHTHFSFFRDAIKVGRPQTGLFRRYLQSIGLLGGGMSDGIFVQHGDRGAGVRFLQRRIERLRITIDKTEKLIECDGIYGDRTAKYVIAAEKLWNPSYSGNGRTVTAETWVRLDDMYFGGMVDERVARALANLIPQPQPIDYGQLVTRVDLGALALQLDQKRLADVIYGDTRFAPSIVSELLRRAQ